MALTSRLRNALARTVSGDKGNKKAAAKGKGQDKAPKTPAVAKTRPREFGGAEGPDPTRYGDWQHKGRCSDF